MVWRHSYRQRTRVGMFIILNINYVNAATLEEIKSRHVAAAEIGYDIQTTNFIESILRNIFYKVWAKLRINYE